MLKRVTNSHVLLHSSAILRDFVNDTKMGN